MGIKDLALLKVVGSIIKKGKDKILTVKDKGTVSSDESVFDTFKTAMGKAEPIKHKDAKVKIDTPKEVVKTETKPKVEETTQNKTEKKVEAKTDTTVKEVTKVEEKSTTSKPTQKKNDSEKIVKKPTTKPAKESAKVSTTKTEKKVVKKETKPVTKVTKESPKTPASKKSETPKAKVVAKKEVKKTESKKDEAPVKKEIAKKTKADTKETKTVAKKEPVAKVKTTTAKKPTAPSKKEEKIAKYTKDIEKHLGNVDAPFLDILVKNLGPSIYRRDAESVSCSDDKELATVRNNFLIKKLGYDKKDNDMLDAEIKKVCEALKDTKVKYRATFYYMLAKNLKKESALS